jgi:GTPase
MYYLHFYKFTLSQAMPKGILIAIATLVGGRFGKQNLGYNGDVKTCRDNDDGSGLLKIYITVSIKTTQTGRVPYFNFRVVGY